MNPDDLGSPLLAAGSSFLSFLVGAFIPLTAFLFPLASPVTASVVISGSALFVVGCILSLFTGRSALWGGVRMVLLAGFAGACTFFLGRWLGVQLG